MSGTIHYLTGDATEPIKRPAVIAHICNDQGAWGAGFVMALSRKWPGPERKYREMPQYVLGSTGYVVVDDRTVVANMVAQSGFPRPGRPRAVDYDALRRCLSRLFVPRGGSVHMPRIGCGIGGGSWEDIEPIILHHLCERGVDVYVYDLPTR